MHVAERTLMSHRIEILFIVLFAYMRKVRDDKLKKAVDMTVNKANEILPLEAAAERAKESMPAIMK